MVVQEITGLQAGEAVVRVNLDATSEGGKQLEQLIETMLNKRSEHSRAFLIVWRGTKTPRGAEVLGHALGWTQHGLATDTSGRQFGTYARLMEFAGENEDEHAMVLYVDSVS